MKTEDLIYEIRNSLEELNRLRLDVLNLRAQVPIKNCKTCSGINCNNSMEWECDPINKAIHWNPKLEYIKQFFKNVKVI